MEIRIATEDIERKTLSPFAQLSSESLGRIRPEEPCDVRTCFQRDRDRIIHSKAFRRLMHKTQVFISPEGDHFRTRLTHTMEVSQIARTIAMALRLNEGLVEAIALGHDLGHTPFGHLGERDLNKVVPGGFHHNEQSVRVVEHLEKQGEGLNLTIEVLDGILNHRGEGTPKTLEGKVVQIADKIAYVNHDIDDAIRSNMIKEDDLPKDCTDLLGKSPAKRIDFLIRDIIKQSASTNDVRLSQEARDALYRLRQYLFDNVYSAGPLSWERTEYGNLLSAMYLYYLDNFDALPNEFIQIYKTDSVDKIKKRIVTDYLAGMTDRYAKHTYDTLKEKMN